MKVPRPPVHFDGPPDFVERFGKLFRKETPVDPTTWTTETTRVGLRLSFDIAAMAAVVGVALYLIVDWLVGKGCTDSGGPTLSTPRRNTPPSVAGITPERVNDKAPLRGLGPPDHPTC